MNELVERVARALCAVARFDSRHWEDFIPEARAAIRIVLEEAASYIDGKDGTVIPGASVFAPIVSRNNMPCMSGDARARLDRLDRRKFDDATASLADAVRNLIPKDGE
jgi:hypothetical protein